MSAASANPFVTATAAAGLALYALCLGCAALHRPLLRVPDHVGAGRTVRAVIGFASCRMLWELILLLPASPFGTAAAALADASSNVLHFVVFGAAYQSIAAAVFSPSRPPAAQSTLLNHRKGIPCLAVVR